MKRFGQSFENRKIGDVCGSVARTSGPMGKWKPWLNSAHQIGLETILMDFLIAVGTGGEDVGVEF